MGFDVRPFRDGDQVSAFGTLHGPDVEEPRRRRTLVAVDGGRVIAAATALWSRRHPDLVAADGTVDSAHRRRGVGSALLGALEALDDAPLLVNTAVDPVSTAFLSDRGYTVLTESRTVRVAMVDAVAGPPAALPEGVVVEPAALTSAIEELYDAIYASCHQWAGRYTPPPGAPWIAFAGPVIEGTLFVARLDGRPIAATSLHTGAFAEGADAFLAPTAVLGGLVEADRVAVLGVLVTRTLAAGAAEGVATINVEYDTDYVELTTLARPWPGELVHHLYVWSRA